MAPRPSSISTFKAVAASGAAVALGAAGALVLIELGMRLLGYGAVSALGYGRASYNAELPDVGYAGRPNVSGVQSNEGLSRLVLNDHGFHDLDHAKATPSSAFRLMVVGNSYSMAVQVDRAEGYVARLGEALRQCPALAGREIETINLGIDGYTIHQQYLMLRDYGLALKPDFVLLQTNAFVVPGDLDPLKNFSPRLQRAPDGAVTIDYSYRESPEYRQKSSPVAALLQKASDHSRLLQYLIQYRRIAREIAAEADKPKIETPTSIDPAVYASYSQGRDLAFGEMAKMLRARDIPFAVTVLPEADGQSEKPFTPEPVRAEWSALAQGAGVPFIDVEEQARAQVRATGAYLHGFGERAGSGHLNRAGNAFFGRALAERLCPLLGGEHSAALLKPSATP